MAQPVNEEWWQYDETDASMVHMQTGEQIRFRGEVDSNGNLVDRPAPSVSESHSHEYLDSPGHFRFDYDFDGTIYPLLIRTRTFEYPNPDHFFVAQADYPSPFNAKGWAWVVDHNRSLELWRREQGSIDSQPPIDVWRNVDTAVTEVAFLWRSAHWHKWLRGQRPAQEIGFRGGFVNGVWRADLRRRISTWEAFHGDPWSTPRPLSDFRKPTSESLFGAWELVKDGDLDCEKSRHWRLINRSLSIALEIFAEEESTANQASDAAPEMEHGNFRIRVTNTAKAFDMRVRRARDQPHAFGSNWLIEQDLRTTHAYENYAIAADIYLHAIVPLAGGLFGPIAPPFRLSEGVTFQWSPIAGHGNGVVVAHLGEKLDPSIAKYGWDIFVE